MATIQNICLINLSAYCECIFCQFISLETLVNAKVQIAHFTHIHKWNLILPLPIWPAYVFASEAKVENKMQGHYLKEKYSMMHTEKKHSFAFLSTYISNQPKATIALKLGRCHPFEQQQQINEKDELFMTIMHYIKNLEMLFKEWLYIFCLLSELLSKLKQDFSIELIAEIMKPCVMFLIDEFHQLSMMIDGAVKVFALNRTLLATESLPENLNNNSDHKGI